VRRGRVGQEERHGAMINIHRVAEGKAPSEIWGLAGGGRGSGCLVLGCGDGEYGPIFSLAALDIDDYRCPALVSGATMMHVGSEFAR
jgi:hypothetical protein